MPLDAKADVSEWIRHFIASDNPKFKGKSKKERIRMALGAYYAQKSSSWDGAAFEDEVEALAKDLEKAMDPELAQRLHDMSMEMGAKCEGHSKKDDKDEDYAKIRIAKVSDELGVVFGWAVICKVKGQPYYDLNVDLSSGQRVPEHVPEEAMLKAACTFMEGARPGNVLHKGPDDGTYLFAFPLTTDIAKAMGIETPVTGLMVAYKPTPETLAKFKSGELKGFSIEGRRIRFEEQEEAAA